MKTRIFRLLVLLVSLPVTFARAQEAADNRTRDELIALDRKVAVAISRNDVATLDRILAKDYTFTDADGRKAGKTAWLKNIRSASKPSGESIATDDYEVRVLGDTALMSHVTQAGKERLRSFHVWQKRGNRWQLLSHQWMPIEAPIPSDVMGPACARYSFEPEVRQYYGDSASIIKKLDQDGMGLTDRTGYILIVETAGSAELTMFERVTFENGLVKVSQWSGSSAGALREELTNLLFANHGIACVGQQSKALVKKKLHMNDRGEIPVPVSARAAFAHLVKKYGGEYLRATVLLLC